MRWVISKTFEGLDRRKRRPELRFGERRSQALAAEAPTLAAGLRQLRVRAAAANTKRGALEFAARTRMIAELAQAYGEAALHDELIRLADLVANEPEADWRVRLAPVLDTISERYAAAPPAGA